MGKGEKVVCNRKEKLKTANYPVKNFMRTVEDVTS
jgi:hypothetical protein